jgi:hypothetical protein
MSLNYLQGLEREGELGRKSKAQRKEKKSAKKEQRKAEGKKGVVRKVAKVGLAPARASFLLATSMNALKLGDKFAKAWKTDKQRIVDFWTKLGGKIEMLKQAIEKGSKQSLAGQDLGVVALATAIATATPIIVVAVKIFKDLGVTNKDEQDAENTDINALKKTLATDGTETTTANLPEGTDAGLVEGDKKPFLENIPMPVKIIGGLGLGYGAYRLVKGK